MLSEADMIISPIFDTIKYFIEEFPALDVDVVTHEDYNVGWFESRDTVNPFSSPLTVLALGALSPGKGPDLLEACAEELKEQGADINVQLLGYAYRPLSGAVLTHGMFKAEELQQKLAEIKPDIIWLPARWPETYSYTLSAALEFGCRIAVTDLGAPAERLRGAASAWTLTVSWNVKDWARFFTGLAQGNEWPEYSQVSTNKVEYEADFYSSQYVDTLVVATERKEKAELDMLLCHLAEQLPPKVERSFKEKVLVMLYRLYTDRRLQPIVKYFPYRLLRKVKRILSRRALYDVMGS